MLLITEPLTRLLQRPGAFALRVLRGFRANQGFLLASAVAFNTLLSILPLSIVILIVLARFVDEGALLSTLARYSKSSCPGNPPAIMRELSLFLRAPRRHRLGARRRRCCSSARSRSRCSRTRCR